MKIVKKDGLEALAATLPPFIPRHSIGDYLPGVISSGHLANLDSRGCGPKRIRIGAKIVYAREDLLEWLADRIRYDFVSRKNKHDGKQ